MVPGRVQPLHVRRVKNGKPSVHPLRGDDAHAVANDSRNVARTKLVARIFLVLTIVVSL